MTTDKSDVPAGNLEKLEQNLARIEELTQRLVAAMSSKRTVPNALQGPSQELYMKAAAAYFAEMMNNPAKLIEHQVSYWGKTLKHYVDAQHKLAQGKLEPAADETPKDRRFSNPLWDTHPYFNFVKQQYLLNSEAIEHAVRGFDPGAYDAAAIRQHALRWDRAAFAARNGVAGTRVPAMVLHSVLLAELVDATARIDDLLLAGVERVAGRADLDAQVFAKRRAGRDFVAATAGHLDIGVVLQKLLPGIG